MILLLFDSNPSASCAINRLRKRFSDEDLWTRISLHFSFECDFVSSRRLSSRELTKPFENVNLRLFIKRNRVFFCVFHCDLDKQPQSVWVACKTELETSRASRDFTLKSSNNQVFTFRKQMWLVALSKAALGVFVKRINDLDYSGLRTLTIFLPYDSTCKKAFSTLTRRHIFVR